MKALRLFIILFISSVLNIIIFQVPICSGSDFLRYFSTKHGELILVNKEGEFSGSAVAARLNGKSILKVDGKDGQGRDQELMVDLFLFPYQLSKNDKPKVRPTKIDKILISEGSSLDCVTQFIILDFTGDKPFVSERFGLNPGLQYCLKLKRVKWGKKKSYIYLEGDEKYIYFTGERVEDAELLEEASKEQQSKTAKKRTK